MIERKVYCDVCSNNMISSKDSNEFSLFLPSKLRDKFWDCTSYNIHVCDKCLSELVPETEEKKIPSSLVSILITTYFNNWKRNNDR